jgi:hypothetical protein
VTTWLAVLLWLIAGAALISQVARQVAANPRSFESRAERTEFLESNRPTEGSYVFYGAAVLVGLVIAAAVWPSFTSLLDRAFAMILERDQAVTFSVVDAGLLVAFFVGYAVVARSADRLVVGAIRNGLYRAFGPERERNPNESGADIERITGWFTVAVGVTVLAFWAVQLASGRVPEIQTDAVSIGVRIGADALTGIALLVAGGAVLTGKSYAERAFLLAFGLLTYSLLSMVALFAARGDPFGTGLFVVLVLVTVGIGVSYLRTRGRPRRVELKLA